MRQVSTIKTTTKEKLEKLLTKASIGHILDCSKTLYALVQKSKRQPGFFLLNLDDNSINFLPLTTADRNRYSSIIEVCSITDFSLRAVIVVSVPHLVKSRIYSIPLQHLYQMSLCSESIIHAPDFN
jgi:hypothetical protein